MNDMLVRGPSQYDCLLVYENLAIDSMQAATARWGATGALAVSYPDPNIVSDHPYYILDVPWSDARQRKAAADFLAFLMSEPAQRLALEHGFRPGNARITVHAPDSPLVRHQASGIRVSLPALCETPSADVVQALLETFRAIEP
jgi:ABC-type sulfate transport system substrate-binding protein